MPVNPNVFCGDDGDEQLSRILLGKLAEEFGLEFYSHRVGNTEYKFLFKLHNECLKHKFSVDTQAFCLQLFYRVLAFRAQEHEGN